VGFADSTVRFLGVFLVGNIPAPASSEPPALIGKMVVSMVVMIYIRFFWSPLCVDLVMSRRQFDNFLVAWLAGFSFCTCSQRSSRRLSQTG